MSRPKLVSFVTLSELAERLGVSKAAARSIAYHAFISHGAAYEKTPAGDVVYPLERIVEAIAAEAPQ